MGGSSSFLSFSVWQGIRRNCAGFGFQNGFEQAAEISLDRVDLGFSNGKRIGQIAFDSPEFSIRRPGF
jgi:hypothetical protein